MIDIDLVMAGSGVRFSAYFGAIKALEELGYNPVRIIGSSGGSIAGALYASGFQIDTLIQEFNRVDLTKFKKFSIFSLRNVGIYSNKYVQTRIDEMTGGMKIKEAYRDYSATVVGEIEGLKVLNKDTAPNMTLGQAARMSSAMPFFYHKIEWDGDYHIDGGVLNNYPIDIYPEERKVIGLQIKGNKAKNRKRSKWPWGLGGNIAKLTLEHQENENLSDAIWARTIQIRTGDIGAIDFNLSMEDRKFLVGIGYQTVMKCKEKIK